MPPQRSNLILPSHIPNVELDILIRDRLDIEANGRNGSDVGVDFQLVEDRYIHSIISLGLRRQPLGACEDGGRLTGLSSCI